MTTSPFSINIKVFLFSAHSLVSQKKKNEEEEEEEEFCLEVPKENERPGREIESLRYTIFMTTNNIKTEFKLKMIFYSINYKSNGTVKQGRF